MVDGVLTYQASLKEVTKQLESLALPDCRQCSDLPDYYAACSQLRAAAALVRSAVQTCPQVRELMLIRALLESIGETTSFG